MARARTIKPDFIRSHSMRRVSREARLTFIQLWLLADDAGRLIYHPVALPRWLYPGDEQAAQLLPGWLAELEREHCIERYTVDRTDYLRIVNWRRHQRISHPTPSRLPAKSVGARSIDSGASGESLRSDAEKPNGGKALTIPAPTPERFVTPQESLGKIPATPCVTPLSPDFTSDSCGGGFFQRIASAAQRALARG